jgi:hypothetical protein
LFARRRNRIRHAAQQSVAARGGNVQREIADGRARARRLAASAAAADAQRQILYREIAADPVGGFHPAFHRRVVGFVKRDGHGIPARTTLLHPPPIRQRE